MHHHHFISFFLLSFLSFFSICCTYLFVKYCYICAYEWGKMCSPPSLIAILLLLKMSITLRVLYWYNTVVVFLLPEMTLTFIETESYSYWTYKIKRRKKETLTHTYTHTHKEMSKIPFELYKREASIQTNIKTKKYIRKKVLKIKP